ncbi:MAG TPA: hypothetical protein VM219_01535 [Phycisphaerae bacterium]|nr:hypothetical protein [Phycisphaerae bacterium]
MGQNVDEQTWEIVRRAIERPEEEAPVSDGQLEREVRRLETRLAGVRARGGAYHKVSFSRDVRRLLARLEAGAALSAYVH